jgi:hypothetical protein
LGIRALKVLRAWASRIDQEIYLSGFDAGLRFANGRSDKAGQGTSSPSTESTSPG